jgi:wyosine [tRNA(Phe)-imidazoG37] synthetase (radical SAM superfamily)
MSKESLSSYDLELDEFKHELLKQAITPSNKNKLFIIVEGISDKKLYEEFYTEDEVKFELVIGSEKNKNIEKIIELLSKESKQFIGIRDADFYHLEGTKPNCENVFFSEAKKLK